MTLTVIQLAQLRVAALAIALASLGLARSRFGRSWRAVCDDGLLPPCAASTCARVFHAAVLGGALFAALAGVMAALYYGNISFGTGMVYGLKVLFVTAVGGYREPLRAAAGAAASASPNSLWAGYFPIEWRDAWMFGLLVAILVLSGAGQSKTSQAQISAPAADPEHARPTYPDSQWQ